MKSAEVMHALFENDLRIDDITWLAGAAHGFDDSEFIEEVILDASDGEAYMHESMSIFRDLPDWAQDEDGFVEWMAQNGKCGFVINVSTPKPTKFHPDGGYSTLSFGYSHGTYMYVEKIEDVVPMAIAWRDKKMAEWREKAAIPADGAMAPAL